MTEKKLLNACSDFTSQLLSHQVLLSMLIRVVNTPTQSLTNAKTHTGCNYCSSTQLQFLFSSYGSCK